MRRVLLIYIFLAPVFMIAQKSFDFKGMHETFGWIESGGSSENSGITTEGYELNWEAYKTPKIKHDAANIDAQKTPILAVTVKIKSDNIKTLRIAHTNGNITEEKVYLADEILHRSPVATTYYYDLSGENWKNYTEEGDHDFIEIGFQDYEKRNLFSPSSYGDLVIEKIEFLEKTPEENSDSSISDAGLQDKNWKQNNNGLSVSEAD